MQNKLLKMYQTQPLMNTNFTTTFKIVLTLCVVTALKLNQLLIFHYTVTINCLTLLHSIAEIIGNSFDITEERNC